MADRSTPPPSLGLKSRRELEQAVEQLVERLIALACFPDLPTMLTPKQVAALLQVSERSLWNFEEAGALAPVRFGTIPRYTVQSVIDFVDRQAAGEGYQKRRARPGTKREEPRVGEAA